VSDFRVCLVGMPSSGKSTALAALWESLRNSDGGLRWGLRPEDMPPDPTYLDRLASEWRQCRDIKHTSQSDKPPAVKLRLTSKATAARRSIQAPDVSGEDYQQLVEKDLIPEGTASALERATRLVLFVRCDTIRSIHPLRPPPPEVEAAANEKPPTDKWSASQLLTDAAHVALLRRIVEVSSMEPMPSIVVAMTAWDTWTQPGSPLNAFQQMLPLCHQYLANNEIQYSVVGLSAQGKAYSDENRKELMDEPNQVRRIRVVQNDGSSGHDITTLFAGEHAT
jgi:hypothetical protein